MKQVFLTLLLIGLMLLSGCTGRQLEEQMLVIILGVDQMQSGDVHLYVKVPSNSAAASSSGGGGSGGGSGGENGEQMGYFILEATGHTFSDALELLNATTPRSLNFCQVREIVMGEETADDAAFGELLESVYSLPRMRPAATLVICRGEAGSFVEAQKPYVGIRLSRYIETTLSNYAGKGFVPTTSLGEALRDLRYGHGDPLLVCGAVNDFQQAENTAGENSLDAQAGTLSRKSVNPVELFGAAATDGVSVSGYLTGYEMALIHLAEGSVQSLILQTDRGPMPVFARAPATKGVERSETGVRLTLDLMCEVHYEPGLTPDAEEIRQQLTREMEKTLRHLQALRCDGMGFGNIAVCGFFTLEEWNAFDWRRQYENADTEIRIGVQLRKN